MPNFIAIDFKTMAPRYSAEALDREQLRIFCGKDENAIPVTKQAVLLLHFQKNSTGRNPFDSMHKRTLKSEVNNSFVDFVRNAALI